MSNKSKIDVSKMSGLLKPEQLKIIRKKADEIIAKYIADMPERIPQMLDNAVWTLLGLRKFGNGRAEPDPFPETRVLKTLMAETASAVLNKHLKPILEKAARKLCKLRHEKSAFADQLASEALRDFDYTIRDHLSRRAKQSAEAVAEVIFDSVTEKLLPDINLDLDNPESFQGKLGELLLAKKAELLAAVNQPIQKDRY